MQVLYGKNIPKHLYSKIVELDSEVFSTENEEFTGDTTMPPEAVYSMLEKNILSTVVVVEGEQVIAYFQTFPMEREFEKQYVLGEKTFKDLDGNNVQPERQGNINLYLWSLGIKKEYRGKRFESGGASVSIMQLLHEGLVDALADMKKEGIVVKKVLGEAVSEKGRKVVIGFCGEDGLMHEDKENDFYMYGAAFSPRCEALSRCRNVSTLIKEYDKESAKQK